MRSRDGEGVCAIGEEVGDAGGRPTKVDQRAGRADAGVSPSGAT